MSKLNLKKKINIRGLIRQLVRKGYKIYEKPFQLNIVGVRANTTVPDKFDDIIYVFYKDDKGKWLGKAYPATTDTGTYWLKNPMNSKGSALLKEGQYIDTWIRRLHNSKYLALGQEKPVTVFRDYNRDAVLDFYNGKEQTGLFGINIHRANSVGTTKTIGRNSAGCQVFQNADDFAEFLAMTKKQSDLYGNKFTYTLIDERAYVRATRRYATYLGFTTILLAAWIGFRTYKNKTIIPKFK
tara:strand:+ start:884 stop:1603 length:720 start_codon:yes stop_codon:yes gene_type:complete